MNFLERIGMRLHAMHRAPFQALIEYRNILFSPGTGPPRRW